MTKLTETEFFKDARANIEKARNGQPITVTDNNGKIKMVIGIDKTRTLPWPEEWVSLEEIWEI